MSSGPEALPDQNFFRAARNSSIVISSLLTGSTSKSGVSFIGVVGRAAHCTEDKYSANVSARLQLSTNSPAGFLSLPCFGIEPFLSKCKDRQSLEQANVSSQFRLSVRADCLICL